LHLRMAVNLSARQFRQETLLETVRGALSAARLEPRYLELELTESAVMQDAESSVQIMKRLSDLGLRISVDDFGTGFSALSYLRDFPFDRLKIDRSFVQNLPQCKSSGVLTRAIAGLAASFKIAVTAEGVETAAQLQCLRAMGCAEAQGFYFSKPKPVGELTTEIRSWFGQEWEKLRV